MALWPYVNGKALMSGVHLKTMDADEMLDVLHFLFEEDNAHTTEAALKSQSAIRDLVYTTWYDRPYKYKYKSEGSTENNYDIPPEGESSEYVMGEDESLVPFSPRHEVKPEIPITEFDPMSSTPFGNILDAPMGG